MTILNAAKAKLTKTAFTALTTVVNDPPPVRKVTEDIYQDYTVRDGDRNPGAKFEDTRRLLYPAGSIVTQAEIDALFVAATVDTVAPATGGIAGGTAVKITGTNFGGVTGVLFGGTAATLVKVVDAKTITCVAPAHAAGAVAVDVQDDSGTVSKAAAFTYA